MQEKPWQGRLGCRVIEVTFEQDGTEWLAHVQVDSVTTIIPTGDSEILRGFMVVASSNGIASVTFTPFDLTAAPQTAEGSVFSLRFAGTAPSPSSSWKLLIPSEQRQIAGLTGQPLTSWLDPNGILEPGFEDGAWLAVVNSGSAISNGWQLQSGSIDGGDILANTGDATNSPFTGMSTAGWLVSNGKTVTAVTDEGAGVLRITLSSAPIAGDVLFHGPDSTFMSAHGYGAVASAIAV